MPKNGAIVEVNKSKMLLFPKKGAIQLDLFLHKKREFIVTDHLMNGDLIKKGDVVLDIGANIGYYALIEAQLVGATGKVYAVEPVRDNFELLKKNIRLNNLKNVETFQLAFGNCNRESEIYVSNYCNLCSMKKQSAGGTIIGVQNVYEKTVDTFFGDKPSPNFIRMDVEGYEYEIICGMLQTLKKDIRIIVELHPKYLAEKVNDFFKILTQNSFRVRFAIFEPKINENKIINRIVGALLQKGGVSLILPAFVIQNVSLQELQNLLEDLSKFSNQNLISWDIRSPNVLLEKQSGPQQI